MPIEMMWYEKPRVLITKFSGDVTIEEMTSASQKAVNIWDAASRKYPDISLFHSLHDGTDITSFPKNLKKISDAAQISYRHPKVGWIVAYNVEDKFVRFVGNIVSQMMRTRYRIVDTQADAIDFLQKRDTTLPQLSVKDVDALFAQQDSLMTPE